MVSQSFKTIKMLQKPLQVLLILSTGLILVWGDSILSKIRVDPQEIRGGRIIGGEDAAITEFPHQASLHFFHEHICGASLISNRWLITSAHCTTLDLGFIHTPLYGFTIRLGTNLREEGGQVVSVARVIDHPLFLTNPVIRYDFDISLLYLSRAVIFGPTIQPIRLPEANEVLIPGTRCTAVGWGYEFDWAWWLPEILQKVDVPLVSNESCQSMYDTRGFFNHITEAMICAGFTAGGRDACGGDSGGPLITNNTLIGVTSWAHGCAQEHAPGVYASVPYFRDWIREKTGV